VAGLDPVFLEPDFQHISSRPSKARH